MGEAGEFRQVIGRWQTLSDNITRYPTGAPVLLPDMLWVSESGGVGKTHLLRLVSEYLATQGNLMDFYGDVKFLEFLLSYCPPNQPFTEIQRLMDEITDAAGFRSEYKGIVSIDIDEWLDHYEEPHFISFMEYLSANSDKWLVILCVCSRDQEKLRGLEALLSMFLRMEKVTLTLPGSEDLLGYIKRMLKEYSLTLTDDGADLLCATVDKMRRSRYFDGYKSIRMLCQDIVYSVFTKESPVPRELDKTVLAAFAEDSDYVNRTVAKIEKASRIGLVRQEN